MSAPGWLDARSGVRAGTAGGLAAIEAHPPAGAAKRAPVLFVPGFTGSKEDFLPVLAPIAEAGYGAVAVDQRGQYESPGPDDPAAYTVEALAADLMIVVAGLSAESGGRPPGPGVHVVGHSFGGLVARAAGLAGAAGLGQGRGAGLVRSLTLLDSGPAAIRGPRREGLMGVRAVLAAQGPAGVWRQLRNDDDRELPPDVLAFLERRLWASSPVGLDTMAAEVLAEPDRVADLALLVDSTGGREGLPVLVAFGADDDAWSPHVQAEMAARLGVPAVSIPGAAHSPAIEAPEATVSALLAFWRRVDEPVGPGEPSCPAR